MTSITYTHTSIQTSTQSILSPPGWLGEVVLIVEHLRKLGVLAAINEQVRGCRGGVSSSMRRSTLWPCSQGYAISGERTLEAFYKALLPWADPFMALFGNPGNGLYREELRRAVEAVGSYLAAHQLPQECALVRLDGQYGTGAVLADLAGLSFVTRGKDYALLDRIEVQRRLHLPADGSFTRPESELVRTFYDCPDVPVGSNGLRCRVIVATHASSQRKSRVGLTRSGVVYELFLTNLPQSAFIASDVVALYLHRGAFEPALADEGQEQDPDRWCSHASCGQECWQIVSQWIWNLRLELGHQLEPAPLRTTEFVPALPEAAERETSAFGYTSPQAGLRRTRRALL